MTPYEEIVALTQQAQQAIAGQQYEQALAAYGRSLKLARSLDPSQAHPQLIAVLFHRRGNALEAQGDIQAAVIAYESALQALVQGVSDQLDALIERLSRVGKGFYSSPEPIPDLYSPQAAKSLAAAEQDPALAIKLWLSVGNAYFRQPQENPALNAYQQALKDSKIDDWPLLKAYAKANIGEIYRRQNQLLLARESLTAALTLFEAVDDVEGAALKKRRALALLAGIARDEEKIEEAIALYQQSLLLYQQAQDSQGQARTLAGLARLHLTQKNWEQAKPLYAQTLQLAQSVQDKETLWHAYWGLGCCQYQRKELVQAIASFESSIDLIDRRQDLLQTDEGKVTFLDSVKDVFDQLLSARLDLAQQTNAATDYEAALAVAESARGRSLQDLMDGQNQRRRLRMRSVVEQDKPDSESPDSESVESENTDSESVTLKTVNLETANPESVDFDELIAQRAPAMMMEQRAEATFLDPVELDTDSDFESDLEPVPSVEAAPLARLVFYVLLDKTAIFAVSAQGKVTGHVIEVGCHEMEARVAELRSALGVDEAKRGLERKAMSVLAEVVPEVVPRDLHPGTGHQNSVPKNSKTQSLEQILENFYLDLVAPVADMLPTDNQCLVIEPHSALWLLPFATLKLPDGQWMSERWALLYAPSEETLAEIRQEPSYAPLADSKIVIVGNPTMPTVSNEAGSQLTLGRLPGAEKEAKAIAATLNNYDPELLIGAAATESRVKALAQTHNIVHLATHGIAYTSDPLASFVAFAPTDTENGLLTAREVANSRSLPLDLVVLSACQTGLGKVSGDGMLGLSRAFLIAGARTVVVSQWSVSDAATAALMVAFYQHYVELGIEGGKAIALQKAMATVRANSAYTHPRYWSAFIAVGAE